MQYEWIQETLPPKLKAMGLDEGIEGIQGMVSGNAEGRKGKGGRVVILLQLKTF